MTVTTYTPRRLTGRCRNGAERDAGHIYHAVTDGTYKPALCGAAPGPRSSGWSEHRGGRVTCARCLARLANAAPDPEGETMMRVYKKSEKKDQWHGQTVGDFVATALLHDGEHRHDTARLEDQPARVAEAVGRLLEVLMARGALTEAEFWHVLGQSQWTPFGESHHVIQQPEESAHA